MGRSKTRTIILASIIIIMVFGVFIVLPMLVPSYGDANCNKVLWGCSEVRKPVRYPTLIWPTDKWPLTPDGMRYDIYCGGRFNVDEASENSSTVRISGYLLYGVIIYHEKNTENEGNGIVSGLASLRVLGGFRNKSLVLGLQEKYEGMTERVYREPFTITTDSDGYFETDVTIDEAAECYMISVTYEGETIVPYVKEKPIEIYQSENAQETNCPGLPDIEREESRFWLWFGISAGVLVVIGLVFLYVRYGPRIAGITNEPKARPEPVSGEPVPGEDPRIGGDTDRLRLSFPDIESTLPPVWGTDRELVLAVEAVLPESGTLQSSGLLIDWGDGEDSRAIPGDGRGCTAAHRYSGKGEYRITALLEAGRRRISSWRTVRIVDYREEMVRIFGELITGLGLTDIDITPETTPRELEKLLAERLDRSDRINIRTVVDGFEEANYSTHPVDRERYAAMYRAIRTILGV